MPAASENRALRLLVGAGMFVLMVAGMKAAQSLLVPVLLAGFLAVICWPPLKWLVDHHVPTLVALLIIVLAIASVGLAVGGLIGTSVNDFRGKLGQYEKDLRQEVAGALAWLEAKGIKVPEAIKPQPQPPPSDEKPPQDADEPIDVAATPEDAQPPDEIEPPVEAKQPDALDEFMAPPEFGLAGGGDRQNDARADEKKPGGIGLGFAFRFVSDVAGTLLGYFSNAILILLLLVFMLLEAAGLSDKVTAISQLSGSSDDEQQRTREITERIRHYVSLKTIISLLTGGLITVGLWIVGVDYFVMWGVLAFFFNFIPNIGSVIVAVPAVLFALLTAGWSAAIWSTVVYLAVNGVVGNIVEPRMMGRGLGLSTLVVFLSLIFWGWVLGPIGMLLSVPLTMIAKIALEASPETRWVAILLSSDAELVD
ncbi:MAG: AI-2E family transporter [Planctomycetota bacterium]|nr:MAG: AI-2E family transporter [Planctomycetota bacterium]REK43460.1 MAG: AI-2E family transporter [Planctomycetota bacterium]